MVSNKIAFIGGGNMTRALVDGLLQADYDASLICVTNRSLSKLVYFESQCGVKASVDNMAALTWAKIIVLAVKPQHLSELCREIEPFITPEHLIVSVVAGVSVGDIEKWLSQAVVIRAMPNLAVSVGVGVIGLYAGDYNTHLKDLAIDKIFSLLGTVEWLQDEQQLAALTVVAASGIAFYCGLSEILLNVAADYDISASMAERIIEQTALGAASMVGNTGISWSDLRAQVTSAGGTTEAALKNMKNAGVQSIVSESIHLAVSKAISMSVNE